MSNRTSRDPLSYAREMKHKALLTRKWAAGATYPFRQGAKDAILRAGERLRPYSYDAWRYPNDYVALDLYAGTPRGLDGVIYCFWTGDNELTPNRQAGLESLIQQNPELEVRLVTPANLSDYLLPEEPLHRAFGNLSLVHRSDYLRCYFMNFFGGGYSDIKTIRRGWLPAFERLNAAPQKWALGYREIASDMTSTLPGRLGADVRRHYSLLIGNGAFIMKPQTPLTLEWYHRLLDRMDFYAEALERYPGNERGDNQGYPIPWIDLLGNVLPPLGLKYHKRLIQDDSIRPDFHNYR